MPWNYLTPPGDGGPVPDDELERAKQATDAAANRAAMNPRAWTSVYGYQPGDQSYETSIGVSRGRKEPHFVDLREEKLKKALDSLAGKRSQLGIDPRAFLLYAQPRSDILKGLVQTPVSQIAGPPWQASVHVGEQLGYNEPQVWGLPGSQIQPHAPSSETRAMLEARETEEAQRKKAVYEATKDISLSGALTGQMGAAYREFATPGEQFLTESLIPGFGIVPMLPVGRGLGLAARGVQAAIPAVGKAARAIGREARTLDLTGAEVGAVYLTGGNLRKRLLAAKAVLTDEARKAFGRGVFDVETGIMKADNGKWGLRYDPETKGVEIWKPEITKPLPGKAVIPEAARAAKAKEPWMMTQEEWRMNKGIKIVDTGEPNRNIGGVMNPVQGHDYRLVLPGKKPTLQAFESLEDAKDSAARQSGHYQAIEQALSEGKFVPPEVLKDYPDSAKEAAKAKAPELAKSEGIISTPLEPQDILIKVEPEPLSRTGQKYVAYREDGTPLYLASESLSDLKKRVSDSLPVKSFVEPSDVSKTAKVKPTPPVQSVDAAKAEVARLQAEEAALHKRVKAMSKEKVKAQAKAIDKEEARLTEALDDVESAEARREALQEKLSPARKAVLERQQQEQLGRILAAAKERERQTGNILERRAGIAGEGKGPPSYEPPTTGGTVPPGGGGDLTRVGIEKEAEPFRKRMANFIDKFRRASQDPNDTLTMLSKGTGRPVHELAQLVPGADGYSQNLLRKFFYPITNPLGKDVTELEKYMVLMRDKDILARNPNAYLPGGVGGPPYGNRVTAIITGQPGQRYQDIERRIAAMKARLDPERFGAIEKAAEDLWKAHRQYVIDELLSNGMITRESADAMGKAYPHYLPFYRQDFVDMIYDAMRQGESVASVGKVDIEREFMEGMVEAARTGKGGPASVSTTGIHRMNIAGSERTVEEPLAKMLGQVVNVQRLISRNKAARELAEALGDMETLNSMAKGSLIRPVGKIAENSKITGVVSYFKDGKKVSYQVPAAFAQIAKGIDKEASGLLLKLARYTSQPLAQGAVTYNPGYGIVNIIRDANSAFWREKLIPLSPTYIKGWISAILKDATYDEAAQAGVFVSGLAENLSRSKNLPKVTGGIQVKSAGDALALLPRLIKEFNITTERGTRIGAYIKARGRGDDRIRAAVVGRDATVDFAKSGTSMQTVNQIIPFTNAALQGSVNYFQIWRRKPAWAVIATTLFSVPTVLSRVNNMRFGTSNLIPEYEYTRNWVIQLGEGERKDGTKFPIYIKIPKGEAAGASTFIQETLFSAAQKVDNRGIVEMILDAGVASGKQMAPFELSLSGITSPLFGTAAGLAMNRDLFTGRDIVPFGEQKWLPEQQFGPETSTMAVLLGRKSRISPRKIDFAIKDYTAGAGESANWLLSMGLEALTTRPEQFGLTTRKRLEEAPIEQTARIVGLRRFMGAKDTAIKIQRWKQLRQLEKTTQREFSALPDMNRLGIQFGQVGGNIGGIELTPELQIRYQILAGKITKAQVSNLIRSPQYQRATDEQKERAIRRTMQRSREIVRRHIAGTPEFQKQVQEAQRKKQLAGATP